MAVIDGMTGSPARPFAVAAVPPAPDVVALRPGVLERRMASRALDRWLAGGGAVVTGFDAHSLLVADPAGAARILACGPALAAMSGLAAGGRLERCGGLVDELHAAVQLVALRPLPLPFEAPVTLAAGGALLVRGIALPVAVGADAAGQVQVIASWREVLDRAATRRLKREIGTVLRNFSPVLPANEPFPRRNRQKSPD